MKNVKKPVQKLSALKTTVANIGQLFALKKKIGEKKKHHKFLHEEIVVANEHLEHTKERTEHYQTVYQQLLNILEGVSSASPFKEKKLIQALLGEIARLEGERHNLVEQTQEKPFTRPMLYAKKPKMRFSLHPARLVAHLKTYQEKQNEWRSLVSSYLSDQTEVSFPWEVTDSGMYKAESLDERVSYVKVGKTYYATYYLFDITTLLYPHAMYKLVSSSIPYTITTFIEPRDAKDIVQKLRSRIATLTAEQEDRLKKGKIISHKIKDKLEHDSEFIEELVQEVVKALSFSLYITIEATSKEMLAKYHEEVKNITDAAELFVTPYTHGQKKAFEATLPYAQDVMHESRTLQSSGAAYLAPFITNNLFSPQGIFMGINTDQSSLVFIDPFTLSSNPLDNSNINLLGNSGSGKSTTAKVIATRLYMRGTQVMVVDPEGEYVDYAKAMNGEVVTFDFSHGVNPFSVYSSDEEDIRRHKLILKAFFKFFIEPDNYNSAQLDKAIVAMYADYPKVKPTFAMFLKALKDTTMYDDLAVLHTGTLKGVFNSDREIHLKSDLVVFNISPLRKTPLEKPMMYLLTSLLWQMGKKNTNKKKMLFIDEAHNLLGDKDVAEFYSTIVREARKRNLGVVSISQMVEDFLQRDTGKAIFNQSETKILFKQSFASIPLVGEVASLSDDEKFLLDHLSIGEYILIRREEHIHAHMYVLPLEEQYVYTTPKTHEKSNQAH